MKMRSSRRRLASSHRAAGAHSAQRGGLDAGTAAGVRARREEWPAHVLSTRSRDPGTCGVAAELAGVRGQSGKGLEYQGTSESTREAVPSSMDNSWGCSPSWLFRSAATNIPKQV